MDPIKRLLSTLVALSIGASLASGCAKPGSPTPTAIPPTARPQATATMIQATPTSDQNPPIVIGAVFNATGWMAAYDQPPKQAALLAIQEINARGGVLGRKLALIELDGMTDPATVGSAANQLIIQGADVLIAPCDYDIGAPVSQQAQAAGLVGVSTCATSSSYGSKVLGDKQFTVGMWGNTMGAAMAQYGYDELGWRTAYIIVETTFDYNRTLGEYFGQHFETLGGKVIGQDAYTTGEQDFGMQIQKVKDLSAPPDVLYITGVMPDLGLALQQFRNAGVDTPIAGGDTYDDASLFALLGPELGDEIYMATHSWLGPEVGGEMTRFIDLYTQAYGEAPTSAFIVMGWDTVMALAQAIEKAGSTDGAAVAQAMESMEFDLLSGKLTWSSAADGHQPVKSAAIVKLDGGKPTFLGWALPETLPTP